MAAEVLRLLVPGTLAVLALMAALWLLHVPLRNAGIVDVGWAAGLGLLAILDAALGSGWETRRLLVAILGGLWSLRLMLHLAVRLWGRPEEGRYAALREEWARAGRNVPLSFLVFFLAQGALDVVLSVPFLLSALDPAPGLSAPEVAGVFLWGVSLAGEGLADAQLARFKAEPANRGRVCRTGLWNFSRHPNYFFEWLVWVAFALFASAAPFGLVSFVCPALMLFFLLRVTGIPATEAQAIRTKGEEYRRYQREVSPFVPWFPRRDAA